MNYKFPWSGSSSMISSSEDLPSHRATWETGGKKTFHYASTRQCASLPQINEKRGTHAQSSCPNKKVQLITRQTPFRLWNVNIRKESLTQASLVIVTNPVVKNYQFLGRWYL